MSKSSTQNPQSSANSNPRVSNSSEIMDEKVANWILEFLLRKPIDDKIINAALSSLPLSNKNARLKNTLLLRRIESETSNGSVSEKLLELLETIEEMSHRAGKTASDLMKKAYCAVAVDCTVRFLEENVEENGKYFEAVVRVWRERVSKMEGLVSEEANRWFADVEAAVWDRDVCERILMRNTRNEALKAVRKYLKEAWEGMGPPFLQVLALNVGNEVEKLGRGEDGGVVLGLENPSRKLVASEGMPIGQALFIRQKHVAVKTRRLKGAKISDADEEAEAFMNMVNDLPTGEVDKMQEVLQSSSRQLHAGVSNPHADACQGAHNLSLTKDNDVTDVLTHAMDNDVPNHTMDKVQEIHQSNSLQMHGAVNDSHLDASRAVHNGNAIEKQIGPPVIHVTPEVRRVQDALKSSSRELHEAVTDPLPEALEIAKTLSSTSNRDTTVENIISNKAVLANQTQPVIHAPTKSTDKLTGDVQGNETHNPKEQQKRKRRFDEPDGTSHTYEWEDSIDNVSRGSSARPHLPRSPKRSRAAPLGQYEDKKMSLRERKKSSPHDDHTLGLHLPPSSKRSRVSSLRERKKWTPYEEDTLRDAVKKFGRNWKVILECYSNTFQERTNVDLKDKWRNMSRS